MWNYASLSPIAGIKKSVPTSTLQKEKNKTNFYDKDKLASLYKTLTELLKYKINAEAKIESL